MTIFRSAAFGIAALTLAAGGHRAGAQDGVDDRILPPGGQVSTSEASRTSSASQIVAVAEALETQPQVQREPRAVAPGQVTRERGSSGGSPQVARRDRSAQGSAALSARSEGRQTSVVPVGGSDRCDPAREPASSGIRCDRVIETRSAEFVRPAPPRLSPEQRLLVDRERGETVGLRSTIERVGRNEIDSNAPDTQRLAAIALAQPVRETPPKPDAASIEATEAIVQIITAIQAPPK